MKKTIFTIIVLVFCILSGRTETFAASASVELKSDNVTVVGEKFDVTLELDSEEGLSGVETYLSYDDNLADFLSADDGIAGGKGLLRVNIKDFEDVGGKLKYKMKFLAKVTGNFTMTFSDEVHLYAIATDNEISVATRDLEMRIKNPENVSSDSSLLAIKVAGGVLTPKFSSNVLDYKVNVGKDVNDITVGVTTAYAKSEYNLVKDYGNKLKDGENNIYIIVKAEDGSKTTYNIKVYKEDEKLEAETKTNEVSDGGIQTGNETVSENVSKEKAEEEPEYVPDGPEEDIVEETDNNDSKQPIIYVIISAIVILFIMLVLGLVMYIKNRRNEEDED